jgi:2-methylcitrate dehydratase PrpD
VKEVRVTAGPRVTRGPLSSSILDYGPFTNKTQAYKSLPCVIGIALKYREVSAHTVGYFQNPSVGAIAKNVSVETDESAENFYNEVSIVTNSGSKHEIQGEEFPSLTPEQVLQNIQQSAAKYLSEEKVEGLIQAINNIENVSIDEISSNLSI